MPSIKRWNGASWDVKPMKEYGASWTLKPVKYWNGSSWVTVQAGAPAPPTITSVGNTWYAGSGCPSASYAEGVASLSGTLDAAYELFWWYSTDSGSNWTEKGVGSDTVTQSMPVSVYAPSTADPATYPTSSGYLRWRCVVRLAGGGAEQGSRVESGDVGGDGETGNCQ